MAAGAPCSQAILAPSPPCLGSWHPAYWLYPRLLAPDSASCAHLSAPGSHLHLFAGKKWQLWPPPTGGFSASGSLP